MKRIYGYCRISTSKQNIDRQKRNILAEFPEATIIKETYTGTKVIGRKEWNKLYSKAINESTNGDDVTIVFDSVSRMSRNADEGVDLYMKLFDSGINLIFIKEHHIDTATYNKAINESIERTGNEIADIYIEATNRVIKLLASKQIRQTFEQAEKEVTDLRQRTSEGIKTARLNGKQIGTPTGTKLTTKKSIVAKEMILKHNKSFGGTLNDIETITLTGISRKTYYKYKKELVAEQADIGNTDF